MKEKFFDLSIEQQDGGTIRLEQRDYCGEPVYIDLHPLQAAHIAHGFGNPIAPLPSIASAFVRRVERLRDDAENLYEFLASVPCCPPSSRVTEDVLMSGRLLDDLDALLKEFGQLSETDSIRQNEREPGAQLGLDV